MKFNIRERRKTASLTQEEVSDMLGISVSLYNGLESGKRRMNETYLEGLANIFCVSPSELIIEERPTVAIAGAVGAGAMVPVFDAYEKGDGPQVECPPQLSPHGIVAVEIVGDSMEPVYSAGDLLFYTRNAADGIPTDAIGHRCVCEDVNGMGWVKQVRAGSEPGLFNLISLNPGADNQHDVKLKWAARVRMHLPADMARRV
ncbi:XRE family transcriptional regulator [Sulfitobacter sp. 1A13679]|uniref:XRE family transcriptional regulator n=1 Tax=Sulfitobacter sp. 1A13679 TaxID=3368597 RepID=UPI00374605E1